MSWLVLLALVVSIHAEEVEQPAVKTAAVQSVGGEEELKKSLQREYTYLASQKEALLKQKNDLTNSLNNKNQVTQSQITGLQKELVHLTAENDDRHEYLSNLEKKKKDLQKRDSSLESTFKKANKTIFDFASSLKFEKSNQYVETISVENLKIEDFEEIINKSQDLLRASTQTESYEGSFLDLEDKLVEGKITRFGRSAAIGTLNNVSYILGPNGEGLLKALEITTEPNKPALNLYIFESINKAAKIKKSAGFVEKLADLSPILFLGMILLLIAGLFISLIRV